MTGPPITFNLWYKPWIRVIQHDGRSSTFGIGDVLAQAHTLVALHDPSPLVVAGIHRLLTAILQAIYSPPDLDALEALLAAEQFDQKRLDSFAKPFGERFELFHPTAPFLQTGDVPLDGWRKPESGARKAWAEPKSVASIFSEVPGATNRIHFHHITDADHYVCPACCARGLTTIPAFASSGGAGIRPSINGVPPVYVLPVGQSLFESLSLSLTTPDYQPSLADPARREIAAWNGPIAIQRSLEVSSVGYLESLTFPARRMRLYPRAKPGTCTHCGEQTPVGVSEMLFEMGYWLGAGVGPWDDPFVAFRLPGGKGKKEGLVPVRPQEGKALWREYTSLLLTEREDQLRPKIIRQLRGLVDRGWLKRTDTIRVRCVGLRTDGKAKIFEWLDEGLEVPPTLLADAEGATYVEDALRWATEAERELTFVFDRHFRPQRRLAERMDQAAVRFKSLRARMQADYWQRLAPEFRALVFAMAAPEARDNTLGAWADTLVRIGRQAFAAAAAQAGDRAEALRARVEAQADCDHQLYRKRKEWRHEQ